MKLKEIEWIKHAGQRNTSFAYMGNEVIACVRKFAFSAEFGCYIYIETIDIDEHFNSEKEARAAVESKIKEWFNQVTE